MTEAASADNPITARSKLDPATGCLVWQGAISSVGYGTLTIRRRAAYAHRRAWELSRGPIPGGAVVDHLCHNRACVNVEHLRIATVAMNIQNRKGANSNSKTGHRGVYVASWGGYYVQATRRGVVHNGGTFKSLEAAVEAAEALRRNLYSTEACIEYDTIDAIRADRIREETNR